MNALLRIALCCSVPLFAVPEDALAQAINTDIQVMGITGTGPDTCDWYHVEGPDPAAWPGLRPLLVIFHGSNDGSANTADLVGFYAEAAARGWFIIMHDGGRYIADCVPPPTTSTCVPQGPASGLFQTYGTDPMLIHTDAVLDDVIASYPIDRNKIYGFGFSMGGNELLTYASRRADPNGHMFAAVWVHSAISHQWQGVCTSFPGCGLALTQNDYCSSSALNQFGWQRTAAFTMNCITPAECAAYPDFNDLNLERSQILNIERLPTGISYQLGESQAAQSSSELIAMLQLNSTTLSTAGPGHNYSFASPYFVAEHFSLTPSSGGPPIDTVLQSFLDTKQYEGEALIAEDGRRYFHFTVDRASDADFARLTWRIRRGSNAIAFSSIGSAPHNVSKLTLNADWSAAFSVLNANRTLVIQPGFAPDELNVTGFTAPPASVVYRVPGVGLVPVPNWTYGSGTLKIPNPRQYTTITN